jgi:hypothetical protein
LQDQEKKCTKCGEIRPLSEYYERQAKCKPCKRAYQRQYRLDNIEAIKRGKKEYQRLNKDKISKRRRLYREDNVRKNNAEPPQYTGTVKFRCYSCKQELPDTSFYRDRSQKNGLRNKCRQCDSKTHRQRIKAQPSGIYSILNKKNNRVYIGQAIALGRRKADHFRALRKGKHKNRPLQEDYDKYGLDAFEYRVVEECSPDEARSQLYLKEIKKIIELHTRGEELYNLLVLEEKISKL